MPKLPRVSGAEVVRALERLGFAVARQRGSHIVLRRGSPATTVWRWDQGEPFGNDVPNNNPSGQGAFEFPLRFPGQYFDREANLNYDMRRDCDPSTGRCVESDSVAYV